MKRTVFAILLAAMLLVTSIAAAETTDDKIVLHAVTGGAPAPYITLDDDGNPTGYDVAVFEAVIDRLPQYELEWTVASDGLTGLLAGLYDVSINNWAYRDERAESYLYSYPYKLTDKVFIQRATDAPLTSFSDVSARGYKVEVGASGPFTFALENWNETHPDEQINFSYIQSSGFLITYQRILDGYTDFAVDDSPIFELTKETYNLTDLVGNPMPEETMAEILPSVYTYYLIRKDDWGQAFREEFDEALKSLWEDGTLLELSKAYFAGSDVTPPASEFEYTKN